MKKTFDTDRTMKIGITLMSLCFITVGVWFAIEFYPAQLYANTTGLGDVIAVSLPYLFTWFIATFVACLAVGVIMAIPVGLLAFFIEWGYTRV